MEKGNALLYACLECNEYYKVICRKNLREVAVSLQISLFTRYYVNLYIIMSYCKQEGKDKVIFVTEDDHETPAKVSLPEDDEERVGVIQPDGEINWNCPCLGGMATGPCGVEFREAFTCFHYSTADPKGSDCLDPFREMSKCMSHYPNVYGNKDENQSQEMPTETTTEASSTEIVAKA